MTATKLLLSRSGGFVVYYPQGYRLDRSPVFSTLEDADKWCKLNKVPSPIHRSRIKRRAATCAL